MKFPRGRSSNRSAPPWSSNDTLPLPRCSNQQVPLYQVRGLAARVYLANVATGPSTVISFDGGMTWNRTFYECDKVSHLSTSLDAKRTKFILEPRLSDQRLSAHRFVDFIERSARHRRRKRLKFLADRTPSTFVVSRFSFEWC